MPALGFNQYGKTGIRLTQIIRNGSRHEITEFSANILFQGEFAASYAEADNSRVLPTDTMKNTVYAFARQHPIRSIEQFSIDLGRYFLERVSHLERVQIEVEQRPWARIRNHDSAFVLGGQELRTATVIASREREQVTSGVHGLEILKTSHSAFAGFLKDELTTLPETRDRLLGTVLDANWTYRQPEIDFNTEHESVRAVLLDTFSNHVSESVQHTLYDMAVAALQSSDALAEVHLVMPNKHRLQADLTNFGLDNPNQIFVRTDEPSGYIEARVSAT
jgi:urate oxidase